MNEAFPTMYGMPIPLSELQLHNSTLRDRPENYSLHHHHWSARRMGRLLITQTVRDLENEQTLMLNDQHNLGEFALHHLYEPPVEASLIQYMDRLDMARMTEEQMNVRVDVLGYVKHDITPVHWKQIEQEYNREAA
jgi:hypothetical protein